jgi:MFS family permease
VTGGEAIGRRRPDYLKLDWWRTPVGTIYLSALVLSFGKGAWFTCWALFFIKSVGLSSAQFGIGITVAGLVGMIAGGPFGYLADRLGAREVAIVLQLVEGVSVLCFLFVRDFWLVVLVTCVMVAAERSTPGIRIAVISGLTEGDERLNSISTARVMTQAGIVAGAGFGAVVLSIDTRPAYLALVVFCGVVNLACGALLWRVPHVLSLRDRKITRAVLVLKDRPYLLLSFLNGLLALCFGMLTAGVPLWIAAHTGAPSWVMGVLIGFNAVLIVLFQNRVTRAGATVRSAGRLGLWAGILLAVSCLAFAASYHGTGAAVLVVLVVAAAVHVAGELLFMGSGFGLSVGLTPEDAHGEYQGVFNTGQAAAIALAPGIMTVLLVEWSVTGWLVLAGIFLLAGVGTVLTGSWALRKQAAQVRAPAGQLVGT